MALTTMMVLPYSGEQWTRFSLLATLSVPVPLGALALCCRAKKARSEITITNEIETAAGILPTNAEKIQVLCNFAMVVFLYLL